MKKLLIVAVFVLAIIWFGGQLVIESTPHTEPTKSVEPNENCKPDEPILPPTPTPEEIPADASPVSKIGKIYVDNAILVKGNNEPIILVDNPTASNVSYQTLRDFLYNDTTDELPYIWAFMTKDESDVDFVCGDFAELLHNNAEESGIRTGLVYVELSGFENHVLNVFKTTDKGLVFIDDTGQFWLHAVTPLWTVSSGGDPVPMVLFGEPESWDKVTYLRKGSPMGFIEISVAESYGFTYRKYKRWQQDKANFDSLSDSYGDEITQKQEKKLRELSDKLGGFFEQEEDTVIDYQIFWEGNK